MNSKSMSDTAHFLLVGNGPYSNRGCEAIVRGTMAILRREFGESFRVTLATFEDFDLVQRQAEREYDPLITHIALSRKSYRRRNPMWWVEKAKALYQHAGECDRFNMLAEACSSATCALEIGGDNYTLDYCVPRQFMELDQYMFRYGIPVALWGASVGPFEKNPEFAAEMLSHLKRLAMIFARESISYQYLKERGFDVTLTQVVDPAFAMKAMEPPDERLGCSLPENVIGLNLSPLMANYVTDGDLDAWLRRAADIVEAIASSTKRDILLIPHVTQAVSDDCRFLSSIVAACPRSGRRRIQCVGPTLSAAETKWVISKCVAFAGARTHSTIAAISSCVPTLSFAYSRKAFGINTDIFGSQDYCIAAQDMTPQNVSSRFNELLARLDDLRSRLAERTPSLMENAFLAGKILRHKLSCLAAP